MNYVERSNFRVEYMGLAKQTANALAAAFFAERSAPDEATPRSLQASMLGITDLANSLASERADSVV